MLGQLHHCLLARVPFDEAIAFPPQPQAAATALGALKVATADQIQRIGAPHLSYRHIDKKTLSEQKTARTAAHTGALSDMRKHGLSETGGSTTAGERLRNLTLKGLEAASHELRRPVTEGWAPLPVARAPAAAPTRWPSTRP
ncbi:hypothetical protein [Streptomyces sp. NPDC060031]|uniref:hypothetical protein n=1 Tax=Streptomyces sp. NPDC060031 TaxID=3347043 RepID=UPI0036BA8A18